MNKAEQYIEAVLSGEEVTGELTKLAVKRHRNDLEKAEEKGWYFDEAAGVLAYEAIGAFFEVQAKYTSEKIEIQPWQCFLLYVIFGWKKKDTGLRRFRKAYLEVARKNGKSLLAAAISLYMLLVDGEWKAEVYCAAMKRDQAMKVFRPAKSLMKLIRRASNSTKMQTQVLTNRIIFDAMDAYFAPLSRDYDSEEGSNPHFAVVDEYHVHPTSGMLDMLESGMVQRKQALLLIITTAGFDLSRPCYDLRKSFVRTLEGEVDNDGTFILIYGLDEQDDWRDETVWKKANPNLGVAIPIENFRVDYQKAVAEGVRKEQTFRVKNLNVWLNEAHGWITQEQWKKNGTAFDLSDLQGRDCYVGIDLASTQDLCSVCYMFPPLLPDEKVICYWEHYCPEVQITNQNRNDGKINYEGWFREGHIKATPGNVTDYNYIYNDIAENSERWNILHVGYDRYRALQLVVDLQEKLDLDVWDLSMTYSGLTVPMEQIEHWIAAEKLNHGNNSLVTWMLGNVQIVTMGNSYKRLDKSHAKNKIDGIVAFIIATANYLQHREEDNNTADMAFLI